jgi:hypothetical protein
MSNLPRRPLAGKPTPSIPRHFVSQGETSLDQLATDINKAHAGVLEAFQRGAAYARQAGLMLIEARKLVEPHGWLKWLEANVEASPRTCQRYVRIAENWDKLSAECDSVSHLGVREALKCLAGPAGADPTLAGRRPVLEWDEQGRHGTAERWWDILASYTLTMDCLGWEPERIGEFWGRPLVEIELILRPRPPIRFGSVSEGAELFGKGQQRVEQSYRAQVESDTLAVLGIIYDQAAYNARCEGWDDAQADIEAAGRLNNRRLMRLGRDHLFEIPWADSHLGSALWCCAISDMRAGLGIEQPQKGLLFMFSDYCDRVALARRRIASSSEGNA